MTQTQCPCTMRLGLLGSLRPSSYLAAIGPCFRASCEEAYLGKQCTCTQGQQNMCGSRSRHVGANGASQHILDSLHAMPYWLSAPPETDWLCRRPLLQAPVSSMLMHAQVRGNPAVPVAAQVTPAGYACNRPASTSPRPAHPPDPPVCLPAGSTPWLPHASAFLHDEDSPAWHKLAAGCISSIHDYMTPDPLQAEQMSCDTYHARELYHLPMA